MPEPHVPPSSPGGRRVAVGVRAAYDAVARAYHDQLGDELAAKPLDCGMLQAFTHLVGAGTIGDLGCGPGHVTRFLAGRHAPVIGVDISPGMIGVAREQAPASRSLWARCCSCLLPPLPWQEPPRCTRSSI